MLESMLGKCAADGGGPAVLPDNCVVQRAARDLVPDERGFALIRYSNGCQVSRSRSCPSQYAPRCGKLRIPDVFRIVLYPPRSWKYLAKLFLGRNDRPPFLVKQNGSRTGCALVQRQNVTRHILSLSARCPPIITSIPKAIMRTSCNASPIILAVILCAPAISAGRGQSAAELRSRADRLVAQGHFGESVPFYRRAADIYLKRGDPNAAKVLQGKADRYESRIQLFFHRPARYSNVKKYYTGRRLEPVYGAYLGAFIDREDRITRRYIDENSQLHKDSGLFNIATGRNHAVFFMYQTYGRRFPFRWTLHLKDHNAAAQLVLSPLDLEHVRDDGYLRGFARDASRCGIPIFLRFAGEMNGDWVPYHGNPARYIAKFRIVARVMHEMAPNVAMVWCPNDVPEHKIRAYYPGADAVDWVGVNFYSVLFNDNIASRPAEWRNPADSLKFIYREYAGRHPIMIGEYAATHQSKVNMKLRPDFAANKIGQLYASLPRVYPRVKAVHWLSMNTFKHASPGRQLNNYSLLEQPEVTRAYSRMIESRYFLDRVTSNDPAYSEDEILPLRNEVILSGKVTISAWARSYDQNPAVVYSVGNKESAISNVPGAHEWVLDTRLLTNGPVTIHAAVKDSKGRTAARTSVRVEIRNLLSI